VAFKRVILSRGFCLKGKFARFSTNDDAMLLMLEQQQTVDDWICG